MTPWDPPAACLLRQYAPLLRKWTGRLLRAGGAQDAGLRRFLASFPGLPPETGQRHRFLVDSLRAYEAEDLAAEVRCAFLEARLAGRSPLALFPALLAARIRVLIADPLVFGRYCRLQDRADECAPAGGRAERPPFGLPGLDPETGVEPARSWIDSGGDGLFAALTPRERELLLRRYALGQRPAALAPLMGFPSADAARRALARARARLTP